MSPYNTTERVKYRVAAGSSTTPWETVCSAGTTHMPGMIGIGHDARNQPNDRSRRESSRCAAGRPEVRLGMLTFVAFKTLRSKTCNAGL